MDYNKLISNWHTKASEENYFSKYVFEYLAFIGFLKRVKFTNENGDTKAVRKLKQDSDSKDAYLEKIEQTPKLKEAWQKIIDELNVRPLGEVGENDETVHTIWYWSCSCENIEDPKKHLCEEQGKIRSLDDWENMVEFWHSIRNNLFHGSKNPQDERDRILIENGYKTLSSLVEIMLAE